MPLWIIFIVVSFFLGLSISFLLDYNFHEIERTFFSFVVGHAISIWIIFILACLNGSLSIGVILLCIVICALTSAIFFRTTRKSFFEFFSKERFDKYTISFLIFILLYLLVMNLYGVFRPDESGNLYAFHTVWADYPFHTSVITSFVYSANFTFPPGYPQFLQTEMHYPFLMDFYSAVLMKGGLDLRSSIIIPNITFQLSFFGLFFFLAYRLTGLKKVGILATFIFIFAGFPTGLQSSGIHFLNPMYAVIMPQRTAFLGMAISFAIYILLFHALFTEDKEKEKKPASGQTHTHTHKELILAGALIGLLPYIHAHSFMVTAFVALFLSSFAFIKKRDFKIFIFLFAPLILLSLPQILSIRTAVSENFFVFFPGWAEENMNMIMGFDWSSIAASFSSVAKTILLLQIFWALNAGALIILLSFGFLKANSEARIFYLPFLFLFFIANIVKFQPWYFDNYKIFIHWLSLTAVLASLAIFWIHDFKKRSGKSLATLSLATLLIACTLFGLVTHVAMMKDDYMVWSGEEIKIAEWVRENTAPDSVFLTGSAHNHPIPSLSGRQRVMGYEGWLWSQGLNWSKVMEVKRDEIAIYKGNYSLIKEYGVDYVCVGPYEEAFAMDNHFDINYSAFNDKTRFYLKYDEMVGGERWRVYEVS